MSFTVHIQSVYNYEECLKSIGVALYVCNIIMQNNIAHKFYTCDLNSFTNYEYFSALYLCPYGVKSLQGEQG